MGKTHSFHFLSSPFLLAKVIVLFELLIFLDEQVAKTSFFVEFSNEVKFVLFGVVNYLLEVDNVVVFQFLEHLELLKHAVVGSLALALVLSFEVFLVHLFDCVQSA